MRFGEPRAVATIRPRWRWSLKMVVLAYASIFAVAFFPIPENDPDWLLAIRVFCLFVVITGLPIVPWVDTRALKLRADGSIAVRWFDVQRGTIQRELRHPRIRLVESAGAVVALVLYVGPGQPIRVIRNRVRGFDDFVASAARLEIAAK